MREQICGCESCHEPPTYDVGSHQFTCCELALARGEVARFPQVGSRQKFKGRGDVSRSVVLIATVETVENCCLCRSVPILLSQAVVDEAGVTTSSVWTTGDQAGSDDSFSTPRPPRNPNTPHVDPQEILVIRDPWATTGATTGVTTGGPVA